MVSWDYHCTLRSTTWCFGVFHCMWVDEHPRPSLESAYARRQGRTFIPGSWTSHSCCCPSWIPCRPSHETQPLSEFCNRNSPKFRLQPPLQRVEEGWGHIEAFPAPSLPPLTLPHQHIHCISTQLNGSKGASSPRENMWLLMSQVIPNNIIAIPLLFSSHILPHGPS